MVAGVFRKLLADTVLHTAEHSATTPLSGFNFLDNHAELSPGVRALYIVVSIVLVLFSGMMAGLTLGLLSLDR